MSTTNVSAGSPIALKRWSAALSVMAGRQPTPLSALTGPMPTEADGMDKLSRMQSTNEMPIVRVDELTKGRGGTVAVDCANIAKLRAVMGDRNAQGMGPSMSYSSVDIKIDMATLPISAGGQMSQQRTLHDLRRNAFNQLKAGMPRFRWQRCLTHLAGARGEQDGSDWILPRDTDPGFLEQMVNYNTSTGRIYAPTYNRHYVCDSNGTAGTLVNGVQQLASIDSTDKLILANLDEIAALWDEMPVKMSPLILPGDPAAGDDPIKGVLFVDPLVWDTLLTDNNNNNNIRTFQAAALERARWGNMSQHPLFAGSPMLWNGILVRKMQFAIRFSAGATVYGVTAANKLTATETATTVAAIGATYNVARSILLSAQALAVASGGNAQSEETYTLLEARTNFERNVELAGEVMGAEQKLRWSLPNANGDPEPTDFGVLVVDSVVKKRF
jgi:hypothetical protein